MHNVGRWKMELLYVWSLKEVWFYLLIDKNNYVFTMWHTMWHAISCLWFNYIYSNSKECQEWIDTINFVAASLSAPPLPGACGSQRKFQRQLMPASYTRLNMVRNTLLNMVTLETPASIW